MLVQEIMTREVVTFSPDTTIVEAGVRLLDEGITAAPVLDGSGAIVGIVSRRDLLVGREIADPRAHLATLSQDRSEPPHVVADVMTRNVVTLPLGADDAEAVDVMLRERIASVPIVHEGRLAGVVSATDVLESHTQSDDEIAAVLRERLFEYGESHSLADATVVDGVVTISGASDPLSARIAMTVAETTAGVDRVQVEGTPDEPEVDER